MAMTDDQLAQQVHDAYEKIELSDDAQDRMLAALLAASSDTTQTEPRVDRRPSRHATKGQVVQMPKRHGLRRWMPIAAVLLAALVVVQVGVLTIGNDSSGPGATVAVQSEESAVSDSIERNTSDGVAFETSAPMEEKALVDSAEPEGAKADAPALVEDYPLVTLSDGTELVARPEQADPTAIAGTPEEATARTEDGERHISCRVYELVGGGYAVSYEGEDAYWLCD